MGAWGEGMQANDSALDAVDNFRRFDEKKEKFVPNKRGQLIVDGKIPLINEIQNIRDRAAYDWAQKVLGVAEFFFDLGVDLKRSRALVMKAANQQLGKMELKTWGSPKMRRNAILRFVRRMNGQKVSQKAVALDNAPLFSR